MATKIDIIIPVFNEHEIIEKTLDEIKAKVNIPYNIFIVYDFDEDTTIPVVRKYIENKKESIQLVKNIYNKGALNAIKTGFATAKNEAVLVVMGDASDDLSIVDQMYQKILDGFDVVCGSRYMRDGKHIGGPIFKKFLSRTAGISLYWMGIPSHDVTNSFKLYRRDVLSSLKIESRGGFEIGMEIVIKAFISGYKVTEVPSTWYDRTEGKSKFKLWAWLPSYLRWYLIASNYLLFKRIAKSNEL